MKNSGKAVRFLALFLFVMGLLLVFMLTIFALWPALEASFFDTMNTGGEALDSLHCPLLITPADEAAIRLTLTNPSERTVTFRVRARVAERHATLIREENEQARVAPGESVEYAWSVTPESAVYGRLILARVQVLRAATVPRQEACGILVLNVPGLTGNQVIAALLVAALASLGAGGGLWLWRERPLTDRQHTFTRIVGLITLLLLMTMVLSVMGLWGIALLILLIMVVFLTAAMPYMRK